MEKRDWIWVAIRVFGIFLLVKAVVALPSLLGAAYTTCHFADWEPFGDNQLAKFRGTIFQSALSQVITGLAAFVIYGGIGFYLVRSGRIVFRWVFPPEEPHK